MFLEEIIEYIIHGKEETYLEYKASIKWFKKPRKNKDKVANAKIIRTILAMANNQNGGVIVIGGKEKRNGEITPLGISKTNSDSFKYDDMSRYIRTICSPQVQFKITRDTLNVNGTIRRFVVIQVTESQEFPVVSTKLIRYNDAEAAYPDNVLLRQNAIYIRSKSPIESREISTMQEWQELIYRTMDKSKRELLKRMPCSEYIQEQQRKPLEIKVKDNIKIEEQTKFEGQLKKDRL